MDKSKILKEALDRIKIFFYLMKEGYKLKDKFIILEYHLRLPFQIFNYLIGKKNSRKLIGDVYIKNQYGLFFCGNNFSGVFGAGSFCEPEVRREFKIEDGIAFDVGANLGMFSIPLARALTGKGKVISIEAEKKNSELLLKNIKLNNLNNVSVVGKGAYSKKGKMTFYLDNIGTGGHSLMKGESAKKETIEVDTLDNIASELKINNVSIIKIDIEGAEIEALKAANGILSKNRPKIIFEAVDEKKLAEIEKFLSQYDYKIRKIGDWNYVAEMANRRKLK